jgi:hypothetical protein
MHAQQNTHYVIHSHVSHLPIGAVVDISCIFKFTLIAKSTKELPHVALTILVIPTNPRIVSIFHHASQCAHIYYMH